MEGGIYLIWKTSSLNYNFASAETAMTAHHLPLLPMVKDTLRPTATNDSIILEMVRLPLQKIREAISPTNAGSMEILDQLATPKVAQESCHLELPMAILDLTVHLHPRFDPISQN
jgi:hypothetical protein